MAVEVTRERLNYSHGRKVKWRILTKRRDSFGREHIVWIDRTTMEPVGQIERHFSAPVYVPDEYLRYPEDKPWKVDYRWEQYALYLKKELREWQAIVQVHMKKLYGALGVGRTATAEAIELAGPPPQDWRQVVLAMRGDPYFLGLTDKPTPAAKRLIPELATAVPTKKATHTSRELRLDPELEKLIGKTKNVPVVELDEKDEHDLAEEELLLETQRQVRELEDPAVAARLDEEEDAELERIKASMGSEDDDAVLTGNLSDEDIFDAEESADPGAVGGTRVAVGSVKSRAGSKGRVRKARG